MPDQQVTTRDLLLKLSADMQAVMSSQATLTERVQSALDQQEDQKEELKAQDARLKVVEDWRSRVVGMFVVIGAGVGFVSALAKDAIASVFHWG